jgi:hypothetical protein
MKALIEKALAAAMRENLPGLAASVPEHARGELPDEGTTLIVQAEIEHRAGPVSVADVTFRLETVAPDEDSPTAWRAHGEYEQAVRIVAQAISEVDCGLGVTLHGVAHYQGQGGGVDGNRWVSEIKFRYGASEAA